MIEGFGVHSFRLLDAKGNRTFVKFHWRPVLGAQSTLWDEAVKLAGADPDFHRRDLFEAIQAGDFPAWELAVQLFTEEEADKFPFDHLDATKLIPEELVPLRGDRPHGARPLARQLLCRDRAGGVLPVAHRAGHRLQQRPAAAGPADLVPRHPALAPGLAQLSPAADQRAQVPVRQPSARRPHAAPGAEGPRQLRTQFARPGVAARAVDGLSQLRAAGRWRHQRRACVPKVLPTTTRRRGCSSAARPASSRRTWSARWCSSCRRWRRPQIRSRVVGHLLRIDENLAQRVADGLGLAAPARSRRRRACRRRTCRLRARSASSPT